MLGWRERKFTRTFAAQPTSYAQRLRFIGHTKPMQLLVLAQPKPLQFLSLATAHQQSWFNLYRQIVVGWQVRDNPDVKLFAQPALRSHVNVCHGRNYEGRREV